MTYRKGLLNITDERFRDYIKVNCVQFQNSTSEKWIVLDRKNGSIWEDRFDEPHPDIPFAVKQESWR